MMFQTFRHNESCDTFSYLDDIFAMSNELVKNYKDLSFLGAYKCCLFENILAAKCSTGVTWGTLTSGSFY